MSFRQALKAGEQTKGLAIRFGDKGGPSPTYGVDKLAKRHAYFGYNFVPLVTAELDLACWLDILFLRRQPGGELFVHGDIDNRIKTLFDCLQIPDAHQGYDDLTPEEDEKPYFCLLENDKMISKISVETDLLLEDLKENPITKPTSSPDLNDARVIITVRVRPNNMHMYNVQFG